MKILEAIYHTGDWYFKSKDFNAEGNIWKTVLLVVLLIGAFKLISYLIGV